MYKITGKKTVMLIDEYDVPLENVYFRGFYDRMVSLIRSLTMKEWYDGYLFGDT